MSGQIDQDMIAHFKSKMVTSPTGGIKADLGKPRYDLLPLAGLRAIAEVLTHGAEKYAPHNWRQGIEFHRLIRAALGHIMAFNEGEDIDPESGLLHLAEAGCNILFLLELIQTHPELDTRYTAVNLVKPIQR